jgi:hypothetical protein
MKTTLLLAEWKLWSGKRHQALRNGVEGNEQILPLSG